MCEWIYIPSEPWGVSLCLTHKHTCTLCRCFFSSGGCVALIRNEMSKYYGGLSDIRACRWFNDLQLTRANCSVFSIPWSLLEVHSLLSQSALHVYKKPLFSVATPTQGPLDRTFSYREKGKVDWGGVDLVGEIKEAWEKDFHMCLGEGMLWMGKPEWKAGLLIPKVRAQSVV